MTRTTFFTATSLDGFIADPQDSLSWLFAQPQGESAEIGRRDPALSFESLLQRIGAVVMGSTTYRWVHDHLSVTGEAWPYELPAWVLAHRELPRLDAADIRFANGAISELAPMINTSAGRKDVWVIGGGDLAGQYADAGLLDDVIVSIAPVTLGAGRPLLPRRIQLALAENGPAGGFLCARYTVEGLRPGADWAP